MGSAAFIPDPLEALPTPKNEQVEFKPPPQPEINREAGFAGPGGQAANLASKFITGWMTGKYLNEQKQQRQAADQIGNSKAAVDLAAKTVSNLLATGKDETDPEVVQSRRALSGAWMNYVSAAKQYAQPDVDPATGKPASGGVKGALKRAVEPNHPQLFTGAVLDGMSKMDPNTFVAGPTPAQRQAIVEAKKQEAELNVQNQIRAHQATLVESTKQLQAEQDPGKRAALQADIDTNRAQIVQLGGKETPPVAIGASSVAGTQINQTQQRLQSEQAAMDKLKKGYKVSQLSDGDMVAMGMDPRKHEEQDAYLQNVKGPGNPDGKFNNDYEAMQALLQDKRRAMLLGRYAPPYVQIQDSTKEDLSHELQDPEKAAELSAKYGQKIDALRPGETAPMWLVDKVTNERFRQTAEEKAQAKINPVEVNRARGGILDEVVQVNPDYERFTGTGGDAKSGLYRTMAPAQSHWYESNSSFNAKKQEFQQNVLDNARRTLSDAEIKQVFPELAPLMGQSPASSPSAKTTSAAPPLAQAPKMYTITDDAGKTVQKQLTDAQAAKIKARGGKVAPVTATPEFAPPPAM